MGLRDIVKYVVACSGILKPIIAKWGCTPPVTTSNFSYTVNISTYITTYVSNHLYTKTTFVLQLFYVY